MEIFETTSGEEGHIITGELATLFRALSHPDTLKILYLAGIGIENSKYAIEELGLTQKRYYSRLRELIDTGLVRKVDDVYKQTALGRMIYDRILPTMGKAVDAREEMELIVYLEGTELENGVKKHILENLDLPRFAESTKIKLLRDYEDLAIEAIDLFDSAEESVFLASNYLDVRVMEAAFRSTERGVTNMYIVGKSSLSSKMHKLKSMLSLTFAKVIINFASNTMNLKDTVRFADIPYTFCVVDGNRTLIEMSDTLNENFIIAISFNDKVVGARLTKFFETLWKGGEIQSANETLNSINPS